MAEHPRSATARGHARRASTEPGPGPDREVYDRFAARSDFQELRRRYLRFAVPATVAFLVWYVTYVICNNWARGLLDTRVVGHVNVAVVFGLLQFASTFLIAFLYARHADRALDPLAASLRDDFDAETGRGRPDGEVGR